MKDYILEFPMRRTYIKVSSNPIHIGSMACQYIQKQEIVFGGICIIREDKGKEVDDCDPIAIVMSDVSKPLVFVPQEEVKLDYLEETKE